MKQRLLIVMAAVFGVAVSASAQPVAETVAAARVAADSAREAATIVSTAQIAETVAAARLAAADAREVATTVASQARFAYYGADQPSDRDREQERAQREKEEAAREKERAQREKEREYSAYDQGQQALDSGRWDRAITSFDRVIELKGTKSDAALYWKAYAQNKLGQRPEALATIGILLKELSEEPLSQRRPRARSRSETERRAAGESGGRERRRTEDHGAQLAPAQRTGRSHPDAGEGAAAAPARRG